MTQAIPTDKVELLEERLRGIVLSHQQHHNARQQYEATLRQQQQQQLAQPAPTLTPAYQPAVPMPPPPIPPESNQQLAGGGVVPPQAPYYPRAPASPRFAAPRNGTTGKRGNYPPGLPRENQQFYPPGPRPHRPHTRYPHDQYYRTSHVQPPPSSLDHFPPLGKDIPQEKAAILRQVPIPSQHANQHRGQQPFRPTGGEQRGAIQQRHPEFSQAHYEQFHAEQALYLDQFACEVIESILPPDTEIDIQRRFLGSLEKICKKLSPSARLIPFGSLVTGFATMSSDIDCIFAARPLGDAHSANEDTTDYPALLENLLQEAGFETKLLSRTRVPIIKLVRKGDAEHEQDLQCDIGFKNHLAIVNTQLLKCYSECDPRLKSMVLFVKWWAKRRHINSPYRGTISSYGYVLMILHYLINIVSPPVLPNLQLQPIPEGTDESELYYCEDGTKYNIWFAKDIRSLPTSENHSSLGELLRGFFDYYTYKFGWAHTVISIRTKGGILTKEEKGWMAAKSRRVDGAEGNENWEVKDRYLVAIEDPFEIVHNVGRTCTGHGVRRVRDEFRRAMSLIKYRGDRGKRLSQYLCEEAPPEPVFVKREATEQNVPNVPPGQPAASNESNNEMARIVNAAQVVSGNGTTNVVKSGEQSMPK